MFSTDKEIFFLGLGSFISVCVSVRVDFIDNPTGLSLLALLGSALALKKYTYEKERHTTDALINLVSFYRKEVLPEIQKFINTLEAERLPTVSVRIRLDDLDLKSIIGKYSREAKEQLKITKVKKYYDVQTEYLNQLEQFSLSVINYNGVDKEILVPLRTTFIAAVEMSAIALLRHRQVETGPDTYSTVLHLYTLWKDKIDRRTTQERLTDEWEKFYHSVP